MTYDEWVFNAPETPEPCECGEPDCTCAQDAEDDRGDYLYHKMKDDAL